jgi:ABC-2 type transport system permease protein
MFLSVVVKYIKLTFLTVKLHLEAEMQYKVNFLLQIFGIIINDGAIALVWVIFFKQFPSINGWRFQDTAFVLGLTNLGFCLVSFFFAGIFDLADAIADGKLDQYLLMPKSLLWHISTSRSFFSDIGGLIVGLIMLNVSGYVTSSNILFMVFIVLIEALIIYNFGVITNALGFYFGNFDYAANKLFRTFADLIYFPQNVFSGLIRIMTLTIIPAFFVGTIPLELIKEFKLLVFLSLIGFVLIQTLVAYLLFSRGLKRYESGNLIQMKM